MADPKAALTALKKKYGMEETSGKQTPSAQKMAEKQTVTSASGRRNDPKAALEALKRKYSPDNRASTTEGRSRQDSINSGGSDLRLGKYLDTARNATEREISNPGAANAGALEAKAKELRQRKYELNNLAAAAMRGGLKERADRYKGEISAIDTELIQLENDLDMAKAGDTISRLDQLNAQLSAAEKAEARARNAIGQFSGEAGGRMLAQSLAHNKGKYDALSQATKARKAIESELDRIKYVQDIDKKKYADTFTGQFGANYRAGDIAQDANDAFNRYLTDPTDENKEYAYTLMALEKEFQEKNADVLDDEGAVLPWISQSAAGYLPQLWDNTKATVGGGLAGAAAGALVGQPIAGAKVGATAGTGVQSFKQMRGAVYRDLIMAGVDEETARSAANDEAFISSLIEMGDTAIDMVTLGGGKALNLLGNAAVKSGSKNFAVKGIAKMFGKTAADKAAKVAAKEAGKGVLRKGLDFAGGLALNAAGEAVEEGLQQGVSIANRERDTSGIGDLARKSYGTLKDAFTGKDDAGRKEILDAAGEGEKIALMFGGVQSVTNRVVSNVVNAKSQQQRNTVVDEVLKDRETLDALIQEGKDSGEGTVSAEIADKLDRKLAGGETVTRNDVNRLIASTEVYKEAEAQREAQTARQTAQRTVETRTGYGEKGVETFLGIVESTGMEPDRVRAQFQSAYEAGMTNVPREKLTFVSTVQEAAYNAGRMDNILSMKKPQGATVYGRESGFIHNDASKDLDAATVETFHAMGKALGAKIMMEEQVYGGQSNGSHVDGVIRVAKDAVNPYMVVAKHEVTHRMQALAPEKYNEFRNFAVQMESEWRGETGTTLVEKYQDRAASHDVILTTSQAMDEIAADFTEKILTDEKVLRDFVTEMSQTEDKRTVGQKFFDAVREFIQKVKRVFKGDKARMDAAAQEQFGATVTELERAEQLWKETYKAASENAKKAQKNTAQKGGGVQYSLNAGFANELDAWIKGGKKGGGYFHIGTTSKALQSIGVSDYKIYWNAGKIAKIMKEHPAMTADVIKSVPQVLEHPVLVMQSQTVANRITMFGEAMDADGKPVLVAVELSPQNKRGEVMNFSVIASAYGKNNAQNLIDTSDILYIDADKKRTNTWLEALGLQLPAGLTKYGPIHSITKVDRDVNGNITLDAGDGKTAMQLAMEKAQTGGSVQYSIKEQDGKRYVQADRQVLTGDDPEKWGRQIETFINQQIRKGEDVLFPTEDGHILALTERSAYKLSDRHKSQIAKRARGLLSDEDFALKGRIAGHIDELIQVGMFNKYQKDVAGSHKNDIGEDGFNYYTAFFRDGDASKSYYRVIFSSALNENEETVYSIGDIQKRKVHTRNGSSAQGGALFNGSSAQSGAHKVGSELFNTTYTTGAPKSQEKTAMQIAFEQAQKKSGGEQYSLKKYSKQQIENWKSSKKIVIFSDTQQLMEFVANAQTNKNLAQKMYFGTVDSDLAAAIKEKTGLDTYGRNVTLRADNIRKMFKSHGNEAKEKTRGQRAITADDFALIPNVIGEPDSIVRSPDDYKEKPAIMFEKTVDGSRITVVAVDSGGSLDLFVQTMYAGIKKESITNVTDANTPAITSETSVGTAPTSYVPQNEAEVKPQHSLKGQSELLKQNEQLKEVVDGLKSQFKTTAFAKVDKKSLDSFTKRLLRDYQSGAEMNDTRAALDALYTYMANGEDGAGPVWDDVYRRAYDTARGILEQSSIINDELYREYKDLRDYLRTTGITLMPEYDRDLMGYESLSDFRKSNFGRIKIVNDGLPVDVAYQELESRFPGLFDSDEHTSQPDQLTHIAEVLDSLQPYEVNPYSHNMREAATWLANDIIERFYELPQAKPTFADKAESRLTKQVMKDAKKLERVREQKNERIKLLIEQRREAVKETRAAERTKREEAVKKVKKHYKEKEKKASNSRKASILRGKIMRHAKDMSRRLLKPTDKKHIPQELQGAVAKLLESINLENNYTLKWNENKGSMRHVKRGKEPIMGAPTARTKAFAELKEVYTRLASELIIDPDLMGDNGLLSGVIKLADKRIDDMNNAELQIVWDTLRAVEASISTANKMFSKARFQTVFDAAEALKADNAGKRLPGEYRYAGKLQHLTGLDMMTPEAYFHRLGAAGDAIFRMMRDAQDKHVRIMKEVSDFTHDALEDVDIRKLEKELHTVTLGGEEVQLTTAQLMELYVLMRRKQAQDHILTGGILPDAVDTAGVRKITRAEPVRGIAFDEVSKAVGLLTDEQKKTAEKLQEYASAVLSKYGNEASMEVYNYEKFNEENYWPIRTNKQEIATDIEKDTAITSVAGRGFTKGTKPNANTSVRIGSIFDTFSSHATDMATYAAWLGTSEDVNRIRNFTFREEGERTGTVKGIIDRVHGSQGSAYLQKLLSDIANGVKSTHSETEYMSRTAGGYKAAAVGANLRVIIQQPTAILRALDMIAPQYLLAGLVPNHGWKKALQYAPIAQWKDWGYFDINTGRQMKDVLFDGDSKLEKIKQALMWGAGKMDSLAWGQLWNAVEAETRSGRKDLEAGSEDYYRHVAARFTEIVDHTQVVDGILQRSQIMRSANPLKKMATSFMAEPTKQYNMFMSAWYDARHGKGEARTAAQKRLARSVLALGVSAVVNAAAAAVIDAVRDDDKEKEYHEKWLESFWKNALSAANPAGYVPYVKDVLSIVKGYDVTRMDMESVEKTFNSAVNLYEAIFGDGKYTVAGAFAAFFAEASRLLGIPAANIKRDVKALAMLAAVENKNYMMQYRMEKLSLNLNYSFNKKTFLDILYNAYKNDKTAYKLIYADMVKSGFDPKDIQTGMESRMKKEQGVKKVEDLTNRFLSPADQSDYDKHMSKIKQTGVWKTANADKRDKLEDRLYKYVTDALDDDTQEYLDDGKAYGLDETEWLLYKTALDMADKPSKSGEYGSYSSKEKAEAISNVKLGDSEIAYLWGEKGGFEALDAGIDMNDYVQFMAEAGDIKADKNKKGKTISGSRKRKIEELLDSMGLTEETYLYLMGTQYDSVKKSRRYISYFGREE